MDEISRELPTDQTTGPALPERHKGPEELQTLQRSSIDADLVVRDRLAGFMPAAEAVDAMTTPEVPPAADEPAPEVAPVAASPTEVTAETPPEATPELAPEAALATPTEEVAAEVSTPATDTIDAAAAAAAVAAEADTAEIEEDLGTDDDEGLPPVPELTDAAAVARMVFVLMTTSRESLSLLRLAQACNTTQKLVEEALALLQTQLTGLGLPIELARNGDSVKWMTGAETFVYLQRLRGVKKIEKLSPAALETLAVIAYRQPVMRSEIEGIRGVKAGPMLRTLLHHKLVKVTGRSEVPGRPLQYGTTPQFLERFGLVSLQELPSIKEWKSLG